MELFLWDVVVSHDDGIATIRVSAENAIEAINKVMRSELCPARAIESVERS